MGSDERDRRFFDPKVYRIVMFDQRGVGKSIPRAELKVVYNPSTQVISGHRRVYIRRLSLFLPAGGCPIFTWLHRH